MAAPASAAPIAPSAICAGVIGRCGLIVGVWIAPVTAQVTITERLEGWVAGTRCSCARQSDTLDGPRPAAYDSPNRSFRDTQRRPGDSGTRDQADSGTRHQAGDQR